MLTIYAYFLFFKHFLQNIYSYHIGVKIVYIYITWCVLIIVVGNFTVYITITYKIVG